MFFFWVEVEVVTFLLVIIGDIDGQADYVFV